MKAHCEYEAQSKFADMLYKVLEIPKWRFIKGGKAYNKAMAFRQSHQSCCDWANEEM